jgi:8-oxo-dGTP pyrophosphatase MutT (NUDIX family)
MLPLSIEEAINQLNELLKNLPGQPAQEQMAGRVVASPSTIPSNAKLSAVMILLFKKEAIWHCCLIKRAENQGAHSGQFAFPGGRVDEGDANLLHTAIRETREEIGVHLKEEQIIGALTPLYIPVSNYIVHPYIAFCDAPTNYEIQIDEVAFVKELELTHLLNPVNKTKTRIRLRDAPQTKIEVPAYKISDTELIWGATAMILAEFEVILSRTKPQII